MTVGLPEGETALDFMLENALGNPVLDDNPKRAIIPREQQDTIPGDVDGGGEVNTLDIVITVNLILADEFYELADLNGDGSVDIVDILLIVNIILEE